MMGRGLTSVAAKSAPAADGCCGLNGFAETGEVEIHRDFPGQNYGKVRDQTAFAGWQDYADPFFFHHTTWQGTRRPSI